MDDREDDEGEEVLKSASQWQVYQAFRRPRVRIQPAARRLRQTTGQRKRR
jgi:hypothetical protein